MVVIYLHVVELNVARVAQRIDEGSHIVPTEKLIKRIPRIIDPVRTSIPLCYQVRVFESFSGEEPFRSVLTILLLSMEIQ